MHPGVQGSGKTLAFALPIIAGLLEEEGNGGSPSSCVMADSTRDGPRALVITPTRELAVQVKEHIAKMIANTDIQVRAGRTARMYGVACR